MATPNGWIPGYGFVGDYDSNGNYNPKPKRTLSNRQYASALSAVGGIVRQFKHPAAVIAGTALQLPDLYYDIKDMVTTPNIANSGHLLVDYPKSLAQYTNGNTIISKADDWLPWLGIVDDAIQGFTGKPIEEQVKDIKQLKKFKRSLKDAGKIYQQQWNGQYFPMYP